MHAVAQAREPFLCRTRILYGASRSLLNGDCFRCGKLDTNRDQFHTCRPCAAVLVAYRKHTSSNRSGERLSIAGSHQSCSRTRWSPGTMVRNRDKDRVKKPLLASVRQAPLVEQENGLRESGTRH